MLSEPQRIHSLKEVINEDIPLHHHLNIIFIAEQNIPIQLDEVQCTGVEWSLGECRFITNYKCDHNGDAGVICIGKFSYYNNDHIRWFV